MKKLMTIYTSQATSLPFPPHFYLFSIKLKAHLKSTKKYWLTIFCNISPKNILYQYMFKDGNILTSTNKEKKLTHSFKTWSLEVDWVYNCFFGQYQGEYFLVKLSPSVKKKVWDISFYECWITSLDKILLFSVHWNLSFFLWKIELLQ